MLWTFLAGLMVGLDGVGVLLLGGSVGRIVGIVLIFWGLSALPIVVSDNIRPAEL